MEKKDANSVCTCTRGSNLVCVSHALYVLIPLATAAPKLEFFQFRAKKQDTNAQKNNPGERPAYNVGYECSRVSGTCNAERGQDRP